MKSGASDPFGDDAAESEDRTGRATEAAGSETGSGAKAESPPNRDPDGSRDSATGEGQASDGADGDEVVDARSLSREELPLLLRRERVKDERPEVHQLFVQAETHERAVEAERELEARLDVDLARTDAREAIYLAGMANLGEATAILREWGYDL